MNTPRELPEVGLYVTQTTEHGFFHIYAHPVLLGTERTDSVRNVSDYTQVKGNWYLNDLRVYSQCDGDRRPTNDLKLYGFEVHYNASRVGLREATKMAHTLKRIEAALERINAKRGYVTTFGEYVARVAEVIGATRMVFQAKENRYGWSYDDQTHNFRGIADGRATIDWMERTWRESKTGTKETV